MKIAFVGKGGSGKSTLSTYMALWLTASGKSVLAIDADHNMDLSYNLGLAEYEEHQRFLSDALSDVIRVAGFSEDIRYESIFLEDIHPMFRMTRGKRDKFTNQYVTDLPNNLSLMTSGPHTERVLYGQACSHALSTPLKVYLPLLHLQEGEYVVMDEKAGADGVGTGIITGIDFACIVVEPSAYSVKAAKQIAKLLEFYGTPYAFIGNKILDNADELFITRALEIDIITSFRLIPSRELTDIHSSHEESLAQLFSVAEKMNQNNSLERTKLKFLKNREFVERD